jgi:hypothetical protein
MLSLSYFSQSCSCIKKNGNKNTHFNSYDKTKNGNGMKYTLDFLTQHGQFYLTSDKAQGLDSNAIKWTHDDFTSKIAFAKNALIIFPQCYGHVRGELSILKTEVEDTDFEKYDHVVEGSIDVNSGELQLLDCPSSSIELDIKLLPGTYRLRIYMSNLESTFIDDQEGNDYYKMEMWLDSNKERRVLKQFRLPKDRPK